MPSEAIGGRNTVWGTPPRPEIEIEVEVTARPPIFLVGDRGERRRLAKLLDGRDGISCAPDSELLVDLAAVARRNVPALAYYGYPEQYWFQRMAGFFDALQSEYAASRHLTRWAASADPGALALVDRLFPRCRVVQVQPVPKSRVRCSGGRETNLTRRLSARSRYYQLSGTDLSQEPEAAVAGVLRFLAPVPVVEIPLRP